MKWVLPLSSIRRSDRPRVGGKAAGLAELRRAGLLVPETRVLTTDAFDACVVRDSSGGLIDFRMSDDLAASLLEILRDLKGPMAVRSSASVEDSVHSSFAGAFGSRLDVFSDHLLEAVFFCWREGLSERVRQQALQQNIDPRRIRIALVVQEMIPAERSGVLFTLDPTGTAPDEAMVSVSPGRGDALMQGSVEGRTTRLSRREGCKDPLFRRLLKAGLQMERRIGHPQDVEWAEVGGRVWFLQSRPITTLAPRRRGKPIVWTRELSEERFPKPVSPLGWSVLQTVIPANVKTLRERFGLTARRPDEIARTIDHYVYSNEHFFSIPGSLRPNPVRQLRLMPRAMMELFSALRDVPSVVLGHGRFGLRWLGIRTAYRAFLAPHAREVRDEWQSMLPTILNEMELADRVDSEGMSVAALNLHRRWLEDLGQRYMEPDLAIYVIKTACEWILKKICGRLAGTPGESGVAELTAGLSENRTLLMNSDLADLHGGFVQRPELKRRLEVKDFAGIEGDLDGMAEPWRTFLDRHGHVTLNWDLMEPTWAEDPTAVLNILSGYAQGSPDLRFQTQQRDLSHRRDEAIARVTKSLRGAPGMVSFFNDVLGTLHDFMKIDEEHHFYCSRLFRALRRLYGEVGRRLVVRGVISAHEDAFFLTSDELFDALQEDEPYPRHAAVEARRAGFERSLRTRPADRYVGDRAIRTGGPSELSADGLRGIGASPGMGIGRVRVVESAEDLGGFEPGDVLVTPTPNPAWTPVLAIASAWVTSTGSVLSHGLVSAREYRVPAVIGIAEATKRLVNGERVRVNGDDGIIDVEHD